ncbi:MAG: MFS transporter [Candidatus Woesearchaeota archaeon]
MISKTNINKSENNILLFKNNLLNNGNNKCVIDKVGLKSGNNNYRNLTKEERAEKPIFLTSDKCIIKFSNIFKEKGEKKKTKGEQEKSIPEYILKERSIKYSNRDAIFTSIKAGFTESFVMPYAIAMNAGTSILVMLSSLPQLIASYLQLFSYNSLKFFKSRSRLIFITAFIQAFLWLPILAIPFIAKGNLWLLLFLIILESIFGTFQGPVYNSILGDIIDENKRGEVLGRRNRIINLMSFTTTFIAGIILNSFKNMDSNGTFHYVFFGFAILFFIAFISRLIASFYKAKIYDPPFKSIEIKTTFFSFMKNMTKDNYGIFVIYVFLYKFAASISSPFFELYLLRDLNSGYFYFTLITVTSIVAGFLSLNFWGKLIDKYGSKKILTIAGFVQPISPFLLFLSIYIKDPAYLIIFLLIEEAFSGIAWSAFNLSTSSFLFDATSKKERIKYVSYYNFIIGIGFFLGAITGGVFIKIFPIWIVSAIPIIYLISGLLRLGSTILMINKVREAKLVEVTLISGSFIPRVLSIRPQFGNTIEIISTNNKKSVENSINQENNKKTYYSIISEEEKPIYEKKSLEYVKENALKILEKKEENNVSGIESQNDNDEKLFRKKISELTQEIKKKSISKSRINKK